MEEIRFIDLKKQYTQIKADVLRRIETVLDHGQYIHGPEVLELEKKLADFVGSRHCILVGSGTDALLVPMMAWGIGPGHEVITSPFSFISAAEVAVLLGAKPVFVDVDERTCNMDPAKTEAAITDRTAAIIPVSLYGQVCDIDAFSEIARRRGVRLFEDACQSFGGSYRGGRSCSFGDAGATSFFPSKPLGCYGDGGAIFTNDDSLAEACRQIRTHGQRVRYEHALIGINARFDTLQAAVLLAKLPLLDEELEARQHVAARYNELLADVDGVVLPYVEPHAVSAWAQYTIQVENRDAVARSLQAEGIPTAVHYPRPIHQQPAITNLYPESAFPVSERMSSRVLSLPFDPWLTADVQARIAGALRRAVSAATPVEV